MEEKTAHSPQRDFVENDEIEIDFHEILQVLRRRYKVILGSVLLITSMVILVAFQLTPLYTATAQVLIDLRERNVADLDSVLSGLSGDNSTVESQIAVIRSRSLATRVVEQMRLDRDPEFNGALREPGMLASLVASIRDLFPSDQESLSESEEKELQKSLVVDAFSEALGVSRVGRQSFVIDLSFTSENAKKAARIVNTLSELYLVEQLEAKFDATQRATDWLNERLGALRAQVETTDKAVEAYRTAHHLVDTQGVTIAEQQLAEINAQLILARAHLAEKNARYQHVKQLLENGAGVESVAEVLSSRVVHDLRQQQAELAREQAELQARYGERHPRMIKIRAQRRDLGLEVAAEVKRIVANQENEVMVARSRVSSLDESLEEEEAQRSSGQVARVRLHELQREASANRAVYETFLGRFKETSQQVGVQEADARVISAAAVPVFPSYPRKTLFAVAGLLASLMVGLGAVFILERLDNGFRTTRQLEDHLHLPHLASIPELQERDATVDGKKLVPEDYILAKPLSIYGEALRGLRSSLLLSNVDAPPRVVLFTSSMPTEGKTTTSVSAGRAAAQAGLRVVIVDADLRRPSVAKMLDIEPKAGVVECLAGQASLAEALVEDEASGMWVLPTIAGAGNPPDLLGSEAMGTLLEKLKTDFDLVVIDSAPVLVVSDTKVLSQRADKVVFIVKWEETPRAAAVDAVDALRQFDVDIAGVVFSRMDLMRHSSYGYGSSYSYYHRYSRYYVN